MPSEHMTKSLQVNRQVISKVEEMKDYYTSKPLQHLAQVLGPGDAPTYCRLRLTLCIFESGQPALLMAGFHSHEPCGANTRTGEASNACSALHIISRTANFLPIAESSLLERMPEAERTQLDLQLSGGDCDTSSWTIIL